MDLNITSLKTIVSSPVLTLGQYLIQGFSPEGLHFFGLQKSLLRTAILINTHSS